jgi:hypothetical protein
MKPDTTIALTLFVLTAASPLFAVAPPTPRVSALEQAELRLGQMAAETKGGAQQRLLLEKQRVHRLLEDLDAGRPVDPRDIDRVLERVDHPF